jgi:hypothetical protein
VQLIGSFVVDRVRFNKEEFDLNGNYTFANTGASWSSQTTSPVPSATTYASLQPLSAFNGQSLNGNWTLNVQDRGNGDIGSFTQFSFNVTEPTAVPFEFEGTGGMMVVGGVWLLRRHLKKKKETKV